MTPVVSIVPADVPVRRKQIMRSDVVKLERDTNCPLSLIPRIDRRLQDELRQLDTDLAGLEQEIKEAKAREDELFSSKPEKLLLQEWKDLKKTPEGRAELHRYDEPAYRVADANSLRGQRELTSKWVLDAYATLADADDTFLSALLASNKRDITYIDPYAGKQSQGRKDLALLGSVIKSPGEGTTVVAAALLSVRNARQKAVNPRAFKPNQMQLFSLNWSPPSRQSETLKKS